MYELQNINQDLVTNFHQAIDKTFQKDNWNVILCLSVETACYKLIPNTAKFKLQSSIKALIKPIFEMKKQSLQIRDFINKKEREEVYHSNFDELIEKYSKSTKKEDKYNLELIDYIYDLLEYDRVVIIDNKKYLYSYIYLNTHAKSHIEAYKNLLELKANKPDENNIDTATNSTRNIETRLNFLNSLLSLPLQNPHTNSKVQGLQKHFLKNYSNEYRMIARSLYSLKEISKTTDNFEINSISELESYINSDGEITNKDIYTSWYAHAFTIYKNEQISIPKKLKLAKLSSHVLFPHLKDKKSIINKTTAKKPTREIAFFKGLRLLEFTDNRTKITKSEDEIKFTEKYISIVTQEMIKLTKD